MHSICSQAGLGEPVRLRTMAKSSFSIQLERSQIHEAMRRVQIRMPPQVQKYSRTQDEGPDKKSYGCATRAKTIELVPQVRAPQRSQYLRSGLKDVRSLES